ncbi:MULTISPECIES: phosphonate utilization transcriptional regulator PhnR [Vibrio]|uniref:phosphonate utilization transcriptional regulator PhnR n=1 Tax=Vibrio TaxID=662 RepID=UPI0020764A48|nr:MULTISPECIES: phosphonate utilization transcriptional regulator PhnR [Vibrio]USD35238.1 phosphonate utilization transcriptional regulator PhnR [Vibrio sp. SCSIO 43186]USD48305.1 phosphonate utilization transcriptional regulator PhnR [Vibrio sp. SCSIO 43145]USD72363.1 phosphonate utilization transcriptional regulator PhnR [Vibrio sp. SCSIO 43139]USD98039.1 phosphonate utilization transcriptional regulator PhnR [Vibrio coralliilyticus]
MQYVKIKDSIVEQIESGLLSPRQKLPAERKLAESFDTTRVTLREALSLLESEGRIYREDRRGWFISPEPLRYDPTQTLNFTNMALSQKRTPLTELVAAKGILANKQAASLLGLQPFSDVYKVDRVRYLEGRPVVFVTNYIRPECFPNLLDFDLSQSLTDIYRDHFGMVYQKIRYRISTSSLLGDTAQALRATSGTPAMVVERINYNQHGELIDCDIEYWRHDAISIESLAELNR